MLECRDQVQLLAHQAPVTLVWVPGHNDIHGNEMADKLAKAGVSTTTIGPEPLLKAPSSFFKGLITKWKRTTFENHWKSIEYARHSKNCININARNSRTIISLSRRNIKRLTSILTGHCYLNKHMYTIGLTNSPRCANCGDIESAEHFLCKCPAYITARAKCLGSYILPHNIIWSLPLSNILDYLNRTNRI